MDLLHVPADHDMRESAGGGKRGDIVCGRLGVALIAEGDGSVEEDVTGFGGDFEELLDGEGLEGSAGGGDFLEVFTDDPGIDGADLGAGFAGAMIGDRDFVEAFVGAAEAEDGEMWEKTHDGRG